MTQLTLGPLLLDAGIDPVQARVIRHAYIQEHEDSGLHGINADSDDAQILEYTRRQSANPTRFPFPAPPLWVVFIREGGNRARLWSVVENRGELGNDGVLRTFDLSESGRMQDLKKRLVIGWSAPRSWWMRGITAASSPVIEIADAEPIPFPGFNNLILDYPTLQAAMREPRYASWRTALASVVGIYLITDTRDGRHYVGKADGAETIQQRWSSYAANGHGDNLRLRSLDPSSFRFSLLRVFDSATLPREIDRAEVHFKIALDSKDHGLNANY